MDYQELLRNAAAHLESCQACPECNGRACRNQIPGPGAKGSGDTAIRNFDKWREWRLNMDTIHERFTPDTSVRLFGRDFSLPVFAGPIGVVYSHYGRYYDDKRYNETLLAACAEAGCAAFTGDGLDAGVMVAATEAIAARGGCGIPTVKPWNAQTIEEKLKYVRKSGCFAFAMDIDAAGLPFLKGMQPPAGSKSVEELRAIASACEAPFILKGIMTVSGAEKAIAAGAAAIVVSNHGGRVLDNCPATAEVLPAIAEACKGRIKILVDGGIRSGADIFKALALGADAVLIARPFVTAIYGGGKEGALLYLGKLKGELSDAMEMCGAATLRDIKPHMVSRF